MSTLRVFLTVLIAVSMGGCVTFDSLTATKNPITAIRGSWSKKDAAPFIDGTYANKYNQYVDQEDEEKAKAERRKQVYMLINAIDTYYDSNIKGLLINGKAAFNTSYDLLLLSLTGVASFAGGNTPNVLSAVATGVQGAKTSIDKNFFQDASGITLVIKMDQLRAQVYQDILKGLNKPTASYPLQEAMRDVIRYYSAGTLKSATIAIVVEAASKQQQAEESAQTILNGGK